MKPQKQLVEETGCRSCPAYWGSEVLNGSVQNLTVISSKMVAQMTDSTWHAMLTSVGKGKFLIRRRKNRTANACPLLNYDVRHIDADGRESQKLDPQTVGDLVGSRKARTACHELLMLVMLGQI